MEKTVRLLQEEQDKYIKELEEEIRELKKRIEELERLLEIRLPYGADYDAFFGQV
jgi:hypothetical protein